MGIGHGHTPRPLALVLATAILAGLALLLVPAGASSDLRALWLAADAVRTGGTIYPPATLPFTMSPPEAWLAAHPDEPVYPYLYPPLWAAFFAPIAERVDFETAASVMRVVNAVLLAGCTVLAWRIVRPGVHWAVFIGLGGAGLFWTFAGSLALMENQPQILVSFLILLALERLRADAPIAAGAILALAAALKVYPVLFALIWIIAGERRAPLAFAALGGVLGVASVALVGWPAHAAFLETLGAISQSVLLTPVSYGFAPALAQITAPNALVLHDAPQGGGWLVMTLPTATSFLAKGLLVAAVVTIGLAMRRAEPILRWQALWPVGLLAVSLLGPLAWAYHFIPAIVLAPALLDRFGPRAGALALGAVLVPLSTLFAEAALARGLGPEKLQIVGTCALFALAGLFTASAARTRNSIPA